MSLDVRGTPRSELQQEIVSRIRDLIRSGQSKSGQKLRETGLSRSFGVSRTPIRAALQVLATEGLVTPCAKGGYVVTDSAADSARSRLEIFPEAESVYGAFLQAIVLQEMPDPATENALMRHFGIGRGLLQKVLRRLVREGLAEPLPGHGWAMLCFGLEPLRQGYHLRIVLEPALLRDPGFSIARETLAQLEDMHRAALARIDAGLAPDPLVDIDGQFHETLARGLDNGLIQDAIHRQARLLRLARTVFRPNLPLARASLLDHLSVIAALNSRDREVAAIHLRHHLLSELAALETGFAAALEDLRQIVRRPTASADPDSPSTFSV